MPSLPSHKSRLACLFFNFLSLVQPGSIVDVYQQQKRAHWLQLAVAVAAGNKGLSARTAGATGRIACLGNGRLVFGISRWIATRIHRVAYIFRVVGCSYMAGLCLLSLLVFLVFHNGKFSV